MDSAFFSANRRRLTNDSRKLFIFTASSLQQEHNDRAFPFRQESNFYYLTGITEPDWLLILDGKTNEEYLVAPDVDTVHEVFEGSLSHKVITARSGIKQIISHKDLPGHLRELTASHKNVQTLGIHPWKKHFNFSVNPAQSRLDRILKRYFNNIQDCRPVLAKQRAIKQPQEIEQIREAITVTAAALKHVQSRFASFKYEHEVEAEIGYHFRKQNLSHAYQPIVASGSNACTLHHSPNGDRLQKDQPVLIDVGAQSGGYAADISRTLMYGQPTERQHQIYEQLHRVHQEIIALLKPGLSFKQYIKKSDELMQATLLSLGLPKEKYRTYFPHAISHGLGLDVHESLGGYTNFQEGMVLTVEPGIYIPEEGIGMRIEDDILITKQGNENLSNDISTDFS